MMASGGLAVALETYPVAGFTWMPARSISPMEPLRGSGCVVMTILVGLMPDASVSLASTLTTTGVLMMAVALSGFGTGAAAAGGGSVTVPVVTAGLEPVIVTIFVSEPPRLDTTLTWAGGTGILPVSADRS